MDFIGEVFDWIGSFFSIIVDTVSNIILIIGVLFELIFSIIGIFPTPFYEIFLSFVTVISSVYIYKIFRKG